MSDPTSEERQSLRDGTALRGLFTERQSGKQTKTSTDLGPGSVYEAVTRQMVESLMREVGEVKQRINQLITLLTGAILLEVLLRLMGA